MGKFLYYTLLVGLFFTTSCNSNPKTIVKSDTVEIFKTILSSRDFKFELARNNDTLHFLKNKFIGERWPAKISNLNIKYVSDNGTARSKNGRWEPNEIKDERLRYEIKNFEISADSAYIIIYHYNFVMDCHYKLKKQGERWVVKFASCGSE